MNAPRDPRNEASAATSSTLLERAKLCDPRAWDRLSDLYEPVIYGWCRHFGLQPDDASDVVQEVFRDVAGRLVSFRKESPQDSFRGWLWCILRSKVSDHYRGVARRPAALGGSDAHQRMYELAAPTEPGSVDEGSVGKDVARRGLELIRGEFSESTWRVFWRYAMQKDSPADIAEDLGVSVWTVYAAKSRVLRRLRLEFSDLLE